MATPAARSPFVLAQLLEGFPPFLYLNPLALNPTWKMLSHSGRPRKIRSYFPQHILAIWHSFRGGKTTNLLSEQIQLRTHQFLIRSPYQIPSFLNFSWASLLFAVWYVRLFAFHASHILGKTLLISEKLWNQRGNIQGHLTCPFASLCQKRRSQRDCSSKSRPD